MAGHEHYWQSFAASGDPKMYLEFARKRIETRGHKPGASQQENLHEND